MKPKRDIHIDTVEVRELTSEEAAVLLLEENKRLRAVMNQATTLLAEVNTVYSLTIHERFERTRKAYDVLSDAIYSTGTPKQSEDE